MSLLRAGAPVSALALAVRAPGHARTAAALLLRSLAPRERATVSRRR